MVSSDFIQVARQIVDIVTSEAEQKPDGGKNPAAVALGKLGGKKVGRARAAALTQEWRAEIAKKAAAKRLENKK